MMDPKDKKQLLNLLEAKDKNLKCRKFYSYYFQDHMIDPTTGCDISRNKYVKHLEFMGKGKEFRERAVIAPNRSGKTEMASYEWACHLMKDYPSWWEGVRFKGPVVLLCVGKTNIAVRNVLQKKLLGSKMELGTGMLPLAENNNGVGIVRITSKTGTADAVLDAYVQDKDGNLNQVVFLSQEMDAGVIMGMALHGVWFDEECLNRSFYDEALARTVTTNGIVIHTFTPLDGITKTVLDFMPGRKIPEDGVVRDADGKSTGRYVINFSLVDTPHLTKEMIEYQMTKYSGAEKEARCFGIPSIGSGQIYPVPIKDVTVSPFQIPQHWPVSYGLDFGWEETAVVWMTQDPNSNTQYVFAEYHKGHATPYIHVESIKARGAWIPGAADPAGGQSNVRDGSSLINEYRNLGLDLIPAKNIIETGINRLLVKFESGQLKIFSTCQHLLDEYALYRYDDYGKPARNQDDHELDALRYCESVFDGISKDELTYMKEDAGYYDETTSRNTRDSWTGY